MLVVTFKIIHEAGLNARAAALIVQLANKFLSEIWLEVGSKKINAKSIMGIISLGVLKGEDIRLIIEGKDEVEAINAMKELFSSNFTYIPQMKNKA